MNRRAAITLNRHVSLVVLHTYVPFVFLAAFLFYFLNHPTKRRHVEIYTISILHVYSLHKSSHALPIIPFNAYKKASCPSCFDSFNKTMNRFNGPREFYDNYHRKMQGLNTTLSSKISPMEEQEEEEEEEEEERYRNGATSTSHGSTSVIGRRRTMEDAVTIIPGFMGRYDFFAVYDGHGGATVANACRDRMHSLVADQVMKEGADQKRGLADWREAMCSSFMKMDREVVGDDEMVGSTAVVVIVGSDQLVVANCGDSRAVLCRGGVAFPLSTDHKPNRPDERERVEKAGGTIVSWNGDRVLGILATSRSIGDHCMKPYVVSEPEVKVYERTERDEFMVIASDGLWDVISNKLACEVVRRIFKMGFVKNGAADAAALLAEMATARGSRDNISVIVVQLK